MILVGQYDSPYVRRVAVSLRLLGYSYTHDRRSVFDDFDAMRELNPLGRIPVLVLDGGDVLVDSAAILDWLDDSVGSERALLPATGKARQHELLLTGLATGVIDKLGAYVYESVIRPPQYRWPEWMERCLTQGTGALEALEAEHWGQHTRLGRAAITTACVLRWLEMAGLDLFPPGRYPSLDTLSERCEALPEFRATRPAEYVVPRADGQG